MRITSPFGQDNWIPGNYWMICDVCGYKYRKSEMRERWDKAWVCEADWEPRHPQEFLRGRNEKISVPIPRPDTYLPIVSDGCTSETNWTLNTGWSSTDTHFQHSSGTGALDRAITGMTVGTSYLLQVVIGERNAGSVAISLVTADDEEGDTSVSIDMQANITFTADATTDTVRITPTTDFDGGVYSLTIHEAPETVSQGDL